MPSLDALQRAFADELWHGQTTQLSEVIVDDEMFAQSRLNIYRNNFKANLRAALASTYPVVKKLVGPEYFRYLAEAYMKEHPSRSGDLRYAGRNLPGFLANLETAKSLPYLHDVARLEWACSVVSVADRLISRGPANFEALAPGDIANLRFGGRLTSRLVRSRYPLFSIWLVNQNSHDGDESVNLDDGAQSVLVVRPDLELELWPLNEAESVFTESLLTGNTLADAVDVVVSCGFDVDLKKLLGKFLRKGAPLLSHAEYCDDGFR